MSKSKTITKPKTLDEVRNIIGDFMSPHDPDIILREVRAKLDDYMKEESLITPKSPLFKAITLSEFKNGFLLTVIAPERYKTFGLNMFRQLKEEYNCTKVSEQATAELATLSYVRALDMQSRITNVLDKGTISESGAKFIAILSKDIDRTTRQYFTAIQTLRMLKQPSLNVNIKTNTAIVGQNQFVQENQHVNNSI